MQGQKHTELNSFTSKSHRDQINSFIKQSILMETGFYTYQENIAPPTTIKNTIKPCTEQEAQKMTSMK